MSKFETLLKKTSTIVEALKLQPCLEDNLSENDVEKIRVNFLKKRHNISSSDCTTLKTALGIENAVSFNNAIAKNPPARVVYCATSK